VPVGYTKTDYGRGNNSFLSIARLKPGITVAQARLEMAAFGSRLGKQYPVDDAGAGGTAESLAGYGLKGARSTVFTLLAAVGFVLLIACVNVANLMLTRGALCGRPIPRFSELSRYCWRVWRCWRAIFRREGQRTWTRFGRCVMSEHALRDWLESVDLLLKSKPVSC
jgi:putative ABC transport system permease protein